MFIEGGFALETYQVTLMMKRFYDNLEHFKRFQTQKKNGVFTFSKDDYSFSFHCFFNFSNRFTVEYHDLFNGFKADFNMRYSCFKKKRSGPYILFLQSQPIICEGLEINTDYSNYYLNPKYCSLSPNSEIYPDIFKFFFDAISNFDFTMEEFFSILEDYECVFGVKNYALLLYIKDYIVETPSLFYSNDFFLLKKQIAQFLFLEKKDNRRFIYDELSCYLKQFFN